MNYRLYLQVKPKITQKLREIATGVELSMVTQQSCHVRQSRRHMTFISMKTGREK